MPKIPVRRFGKWISIEADIDQCSAMKAGKGCDPLPGLTCSGGRLVGGFTFFRSLAFSLPCALRSIGGSAFAKATGGRFPVPTPVRRGHCRLAPAPRVLPREGSGPRGVASILHFGQRGAHHQGR